MHASITKRTGRQAESFFVQCIGGEQLGDLRLLDLVELNRTKGCDVSLGFHTSVKFVERIIYEMHVVIFWPSATSPWPSVFFFSN